MVDEPLALRRVAAIRTRIARLREVLPADRAAFIRDEDAQERVAFNLILAIQSLKQDLPDLENAAAAILTWVESRRGR